MDGSVNCHAPPYDSWPITPTYLLHLLVGGATNRVLEHDADPETQPLTYICFLTILYIATVWYRIYYCTLQTHDEASLSV